MKAQKYVRKMRDLLEKMTMEGHINSPERYVAAEDVSFALKKLDDAIKQNMRK